MSVRSEKRERIEARETRKSWLKVTEVDIAALDDHISDVTSLGC
jgi:hypothetical protein